MKRKLIGIFTLLAVFSVFAAGCSLGTDKKENENATSKDLLHAEWEEVLEKADGQTVNMYMWGGSDTINRYIDEWVAPRLKEESGVTLKRIPMNDTKDIINQFYMKSR